MPFFVMISQIIIIFILLFQFQLQSQFQMNELIKIYIVIITKLNFSLTTITTN
jgi:hypothetical protein